ncbi:hypothetical protein XENORESO_002046 [Xenotaenia resolanae]|uniref:Uncharacterized protein n=1 Tax=Xenotaenia resolanae TaxID=208358 RepID=A0ABV0WW94_9TELE
MCVCLQRDISARCLSCPNPLETSVEEIDSLEKWGFYTGSDITGSPLLPPLPKLFWKSVNAIYVESSRKVCIGLHVVIHGCGFQHRDALICVSWRKTMSADKDLRCLKTLPLFIALPSPLTFHEAALGIYLQSVLKVAFTEQKLMVQLCSLVKFQNESHWQMYKNLT